jgi:hypothetical protein
MWLKAGTKDRKKPVVPSTFSDSKIKACTPSRTGFGFLVIELLVTDWPFFPQLNTTWEEGDIILLIEWN